MYVSMFNVWGSCSPVSEKPGQPVGKINNNEKGGGGGV